MDQCEAKVDLRLESAGDYILSQKLGRKRNLQQVKAESRQLVLDKDSDKTPKTLHEDNSCTPTSFSSLSSTELLSMANDAKEYIEQKPDSALRRDSGTLSSLFFDSSAAPSEDPLFALSGRRGRNSRGYDSSNSLLLGINSERLSLPARISLGPEDFSADFLDGNTVGSEGRGRAALVASAAAAAASSAGLIYYGSTLPTQTGATGVHRHAAEEPKLEPSTRMEPIRFMCGQMSCAIVGHYVDGGNQEKKRAKPVTYYKIKCTWKFSLGSDKDIEWTVDRRYTDFYFLAKDLSAKSPKSWLPSSFRLPILPRRHLMRSLFTNQTSSKAFVLFREIKLAQYLAQLFAIGPPLLQQDAVRNFLSIEKPPLIADFLASRGEAKCVAIVSRCERVATSLKNTLTPPAPSTASLSALSSSSSSSLLADSPSQLTASSKQRLAVEEGYVQKIVNEIERQIDVKNGGSLTLPVSIAAPQVEVNEVLVDEKWRLKAAKMARVYADELLEVKTVIDQTLLDAIRSVQPREASSEETRSVDNSYYLPKTAIAILQTSQRLASATLAEYGSFRKKHYQESLSARSLLRS